MNKQSIL